jgi:hypothetical protein
LLDPIGHRHGSELKFDAPPIHGVSRAVGIALLRSLAGGRAVGHHHAESTTGRSGFMRSRGENFAALRYGADAPSQNPITDSPQISISLRICTT